MTWSVFGPVAHAPQAEAASFCAALLACVDSRLPMPNSATISLWRRIPHPDTLVSGGPEIDFMVTTDSTVVLGEAKWRSGVGARQGKNRDKDQIQLRTEFIQKYGRVVFPDTTHFVVLGASRGKPVVVSEDLSVDGRDLILRDLPWKTICSLQPHPAEDELLEYYEWKSQHSLS